MAENEVKLLPCPFCGKANQDRWPCEWLDGSGANVIRCTWCHGAAPADVWNRRAYATEAVRMNQHVGGGAVAKNKWASPYPDAAKDPFNSLLTAPPAAQVQQEAAYWERWHPVHGVVSVNREPVGQSFGDARWEDRPLYRSANPADTLVAYRKLEAALGQGKANAD